MAIAIAPARALWINVSVRSVMDVSGFAEQPLAQFEAENGVPLEHDWQRSHEIHPKRPGMAALNLPASFAIRAP